VSVNQDQVEVKPSAGSGAAAKESDEKETLIKEAAEQVLRIIDHKKER
jgi:hypothetical protein